MNMFKLYGLAGFWSYPDARAEDFWCGLGMSWRCRLLVVPWLLKAVKTAVPAHAQLTHKFRWIFQMNMWIKEWWVAPWHCTSRRLRMWRVAWRRWHWSKLPCLGHGDFPMFDVPPEGNNPTRWLYIYISPWHPHDIPIIFLISLLYPYCHCILIISLLSLLSIGILYLLYPYYILLFAKSLRCGNFVCGLLCRPPWQSSGEGVASAHRRSEHVEAGATHTHTYTNMIYDIIYTH